mgnify:CR=1 FL=1
MIKFKDICILTSSQSWFIHYAQDLKNKLEHIGYSTRIYHHHKDVPDDVELVFLLSYFTRVDSFFLHKHKHTLVVHESDLPNGKGWSPLFWQIIEGKNEIPVVLIEAAEQLDSGVIYLKDTIKLNGYELHDEIRMAQASITTNLCIKFLREYNNIKPYAQREQKESFFQKRTQRDSKLDIKKPIIEQFNLLRTVNNKEFPAFFEIDKHKYILKIEKTDD